VELEQLVLDIARGIKLADSRGPVAFGVRTKEPYQPAIGPHTEAKTISLVFDELKASPGSPYAGKIHLQVPYPSAARSRCDVCIGDPPHFEWAIEVKMLRIMGDNAKPNDNMLMHILSPYPQHRSALTDAEKLLNSGFSARKAVVIYGFDYQEWPMALAIDAFEALAARSVTLTPPASRPLSMASSIRFIRQAPSSLGKSAREKSGELSGCPTTRCSGPG